MTRKQRPTRAFDAKGKPVDFREATKTEMKDDIATRQLVEHTFGTYLPNPDAILKAKGKDVSIYREIEGDARVGSALLSRESALKKMSYRVKDNGASKKSVEVVQSWLSRMDVDQIKGEMFEGVKFGFKPLEILWKYDALTGWILPLGRPTDENGQEVETEAVGIVGKPPEWFLFDQWNRLLLKTKDKIEGEIVPDRKFVLCRNRATYSNPYGEPLLSKVFWSVTFKKAGLKFWVGFVEKYGFPWVTGKYKAGTKQSEIDSMLDMLEQMVQDGVAVFQDTNEIQFHEPSRASSVDAFERLVEFCNKEISTAVLGGNLTTEVSGGALASTQVHQEIRGDIVEADANVIQSGFNQVIKHIVQVNTGESVFPEIELFDDSLDEKSMAERDEKLNSLGVKFTAEYFKRTYGLGDEDFTLGPDENKDKPGGLGPTPGPNVDENGKPVDFAEAGLLPFDGQDWIDGLLEKVGEQNFKEMSLEFLKPVFDLVAESNDYNEILEGLVKVFPAMETNKLESVMAKAIFLAESTGLKSVQKETEG